MPGGIVVRYPDAAAAARRVAGVATAARTARDLVAAGRDPVWIVLPEGAALPAAAAADLARLAPAARLAAGEDQPPAGLEAIAAPRLDAAGILRATAKDGDGPVSRALNRPVSRRLSAALLLWPGVRPIHATFGTLAIAVVMFLCLLLGGAPGLVAGGLLFHAASVFDGVDGEIARATFRSSAAGAALDSLVDVVTNLAFVIGVVCNLVLGGRPEAAWIGGWGLTMFATGLAALTWRAARGPGEFRLNHVKLDYRDRYAGALLPALIRFLTTVSSRDFFALLFALLLVAGRPLTLLWIFAAAATVWLAFVLAAVPPRGASPQRNA